MELLFGKKYRIRKADKLNLVVEELCTREDKETKAKRKEWVFDGYHGSLRTALGSVAEKRISRVDAKSIEEIRAEILEVRKDVNEICDILREDRAFLLSEVSLG